MREAIEVREWFQDDRSWKPKTIATRTIRTVFPAPGLHAVIELDGADNVRTIESYEEVKKLWLGDGA